MSGRGPRVPLAAAAVLLVWPAFAASSSSVYVVDQGSATVAQYSVGADGALAPKTPAGVPVAGRGVAVSPDGASVYVTAAGSIQQFSAWGGGILVPKTPPAVAAGSHPQEVAVSPDGASVYVTNADSNNVSQYSVTAGGALEPKTPATITTQSGPQGVAISPDGASVYVTNSRSASLSQYSVAAGGMLEPKTPPTVVTGGFPVGVVVSPDGGSVYVAGGDVLQYSALAGGILAPATRARHGGRDVGISPDGASIYVTDFGASSIWQYSVAAGGAPVPKAPPAIDVGQFPTALAVSPDGRNIYVTAVPGGSVLQYGAGSDGALSLKGGLAATTPVAVAVSPDQAGLPPFAPPGAAIDPPPRPAGCARMASKLSLTRARISRAARTISILAPITRRASGTVQITLRAAGRTTRFAGRIDRRRGRVRVTHPIGAAQAGRGTGIVTIAYRGDADTRAQSLHLRAAGRAADLRVTRAQITRGGYLRAAGTLSPKARGVVRVHVQYVNSSDGVTMTLKRSGTIADGRWSINRRLPPGVRTQIARRCGAVHSYISFPGEIRRGLRGEQRALQILPAA